MPDSSARVGCLASLLRGLARLLFGWMFVDRVPPVRVNERFLSPAELSFFRVLRGVVGGRGHVVFQVQLRQLLYFPEGRDEAVRRWGGRAARRAIDFVVCDPRTLRPLLAIELDDATHDRPDRQARDAQVEQLLAAAGLPLIGVRVRVRRSYDARELAGLVDPHLPPA